MRDWHERLDTGTFLLVGAELTSDLPPTYLKPLQDGSLTVQCHLRSVFKTPHCRLRSGFQDRRHNGVIIDAVIFRTLKTVCQNHLEQACNPRQH
ncbi:MULTISPECIES: hypothetical protein [Burkholderiales]|uniref:hypothetical protein n=1 Tax=Burkholderiales TaxID=80840 RepID=UPI00359F96BE